MPALRTMTHDTTFPTTRKTKTMHTETTTRRFVLHSVRSDRAEDLRASQLTNVAADEIAWFYTSYDNAPSSLLARSTIEGWLSALDPAERRTLSLRFDVAPWAEDLQAEGLQSGFALAVDLVSSARWHPKSSPRDAKHRRASEYLEEAVRERGIEAVHKVGRRADWDFASAVRAYASARGRSPSVLPRRAA